MKRRRFLMLAGLSVASGGGLFFLSRVADYWLAQLRVATMAAIPTLTALPDPISRDGWGARAVNHEAVSEYGFASPANPFGWMTYDGDLREAYHTVAIHHSAYARQQGKIMRDFQDVHMDGRHWADIGYHFGIDPDGQIYAGRDIGSRGASVAGHNTGLIGIVVMGHFEWEAPTDAQLAALQTLVNHLTTSYDLTHLAGHGDLNADTACPGRYLKLYLDLLAQGAGLQRGYGAAT
jgi:N-acetylmuramoyl-L-alanine amidase